MAAASASRNPGTYARCGAKTRAGTPCAYPAGRGTDHVGFGNCKHHFGATPSGAKHAAKLEAAALAEARGIEPFAAIQQSLDNANGMLAFFEAKVRALPAAKVVSKDELNVWVREYRAANGDVAHFGKLAIDAGVAERYVRVAEHTADAVARAFDYLIGELGLNATQMRRAPGAVRRSLQLVEAPPVVAA